MRRGGGRELKAPDQDCGPRWRGSLARWDPAMSLWRTPQCSLLEGLDVFSETWPRWGLMHGGECSALPMPARLTSGNESGSWPTIRKSDADRGGRGDLLQAVSGNQNSHFKFPTPTVHGNYQTPKPGTKRGTGLATAVKTWPTPAASKHTRNAANAEDLMQANGLSWVPGTKPYSRKTGKPVQTTLADAVMWPTPTAVTDSGGAALCKWGGAGARAKLRTMVDDKTLNGALNPTWVEWLMGWPLGWTDCAVSATDKFRQWFGWHGKH